MAKYIYDPDASKPTRIAGGGEFAADEWFDVKPELQVGDAVMIQTTDPKLRTMAVIASMIVDWSLKDKAGNPLPINALTVSQLPIDLVAPLFEHMESASFMAGLSRLMSLGKSRHSSAVAVPSTQTT